MHDSAPDWEQIVFPARLHSNCHIDDAILWAMAEGIVVLQRGREVSVKLLKRKGRMNSNHVLISNLWVTLIPTSSYCSNIWKKYKMYTYWLFQKNYNTKRNRDQTWLEQEQGFDEVRDCPNDNHAAPLFPGTYYNKLSTVYISVVTKQNTAAVAAFREEKDLSVVICTR